MEFWVEMSDWGEDMFNIASLAHFVYGLGHERSMFAIDDSYWEFIFATAIFFALFLAGVYLFKRNNRLGIALFAALAIVFNIIGIFLNFSNDSLFSLVVLPIVYTFVVIGYIVYSFYPVTMVTETESKEAEGSELADRHEEIDCNDGIEIQKTFL